MEARAIGGSILGIRRVKMEVKGTTTQVKNRVRERD